MNNKFEFTTSEELCERYVKLLQSYNEMINVLETTTNILSNCDEEILIIQKELENRNITIREIDEKK